MVAYDTLGLLQRPTTKAMWLLCAQVTTNYRQGDRLLPGMGRVAKFMCFCLILVKAHSTHSALTSPPGF
eukprot:scaffold269327_cov23-Tisochrysis_lutea.AAC.1